MKVKLTATKLEKLIQLVLVLVYRIGALRKSLFKLSIEHFTPKP